MSVCVVVPCYQEIRRLERTFDGLDRAAVTLGEASAIVVDDGSTDGTADRAEELAAQRPWVRVLRQPHRGKGGAVRAGMLAADADWLVMADADWSMPPEQLARLLPPEAPVADVVIASREHPSSVRYGEPEHRHIIGRAFNHLVRALVLPGIQDTQCGFKAFSRAAARDLFDAATLDGWAFDVEVLQLAHRRGYRVAEVPVDWTFDGQTRVRPGSDSVAMALDLLRLRRRR